MKFDRGPIVADSFDSLASADLAGAVVTQVSAGMWQVILVLQGEDSPPQDTNISIESSITLRDSRGTNVRLDSLDSMVEASRALIGLLQKTVSGHSFDGRDLELRFSSGETLTIHGEDKPYESYQVTHRGIIYVVGPLPA